MNGAISTATASTHFLCMVDAVRAVVAAFPTAPRYSSLKRKTRKQKVPGSVAQKLQCNIRGGQVSARQSLHAHGSRTFAYNSVGLFHGVMGTGELVKK